MAERNDTQTYANDSATSSPANTGPAQSRSGPVRYELIDKDGKVLGWQFASVVQAASYAAKWYPGEPQDPERSGIGWDVQISKGDWTQPAH